MDWDNYFIIMANMVGVKSKDESSKIGAIIVGPDNEIRSTGYNGLPRGMDDSRPEYQERPYKYKLFEHAERNAIFNAARFGAKLSGCTLYCFWPPCSDCARAIVQAGIGRVVSTIPVRDCPERWYDDMMTGQKILKECGVAFDVVPIHPDIVKFKNEISQIQVGEVPAKETPKPTLKGKGPESMTKLKAYTEWEKFIQSLNIAPAHVDFLMKEIRSAKDENEKKVDPTSQKKTDMAPKNHEIEGKFRPSLLPLDILMEFQCSAYEEGVIKYSRESWRKGFPVSVMIDAALRHIIEFFWLGNDIDESAPTKKHHLTGAIFSLTCILQTLKTRPDLDDRKDFFTCEEI